jgi:hypothetical protein
MGEKAAQQADEGETLSGGMANADAVFRHGDVVDRPAPPHAAALHTHLERLHAAGFTEAPRPLGVSADGAREQLGFLPGDVPLPPFPAWALTDDALTSVGRLLRRLHDASATVDVDADADWPTHLADPVGGPVLCHNDVCPQNVVFRDGRAAALIDFDQAAPGRPLWDLAMTARHWVPVLDPESAAPLGMDGLDVHARLRLLADGYGLTGPGRAALPEAIEQAVARGRSFVTDRVDAGDPAYVHALAAQGGWTRWDRLQTWVATRRTCFAAALHDD